MTRDDIIRMATEAGGRQASYHELYDHLLMSTDALERFSHLAAAAGAAAEREKVAQWMLQRSYATGHGDTTEDLLSELEWQVAERERDRCCRIVYGMAGSDNVAQRTVEAIRGET